MKCEVLYLTRTGLLEPLGQSQVLSYLRGLSKVYRVTLITYERDADWANHELLASLKAECDSLGINWLPQRFLLKPRLIASLLNMAGMFALALKQVRKKNVQLIHARSYIPAMVALAISKLTGVPYIFDMRALWPEEMITAGRLKRDSLIHRALVWAEKTCLKHAECVVSLTHAAVDYLQRQYPQHFAVNKVVVIPTCADLDRFTPLPNVPPSRTVGCLGSVLSGWFRIDWLRDFMLLAKQQDANTHFQVTTRDDVAKVRAKLDENCQLGDALEIAPSPASAVHLLLQQQMASVMLYAGGAVSELGRSPTRMAEVLGCGVPVVANAGVGDVARIISDYRVGVLVESGSKADLLAAWNELQTLRLDADLPRRCRQAAEDVFSLKAGTESYLRVYSRLLARPAMES